MSTDEVLDMALRTLLALAILSLVACGGQHALDTTNDVPHTESRSTQVDGKAPGAEAITGTWRGTSICTPVRPACNDEIAVYHIAPTPDPHVVAMTMNKVVHGEEVEMGGVLSYAVDYSTHTLTHEIAARDGTRAVFDFTWSGNKMTGTLTQLPGREIIRNIELVKE